MGDDGRMIVVLGCEDISFFDKSESILLISSSIFLYDLEDVIDYFDGLVILFLMAVTFG